MNTVTSSVQQLEQFAAELLPLLRTDCSTNVLAQDAEFNRRALALFARQWDALPLYRQFCRQRRTGVETIGHWSEIPALPVSAFKQFEVSSIPDGERSDVFYSSGTTGQAPSRHFHHDASLAVYEASLLPLFASHFFGERTEPMKLIFLTPENAPHSSLAHMFKTVRKHYGTADSAFVGELNVDGSWNVDLGRAFALLRAATESKERIGLLGTAFSFVHLLEAAQAAGTRFSLPIGSRLMETGGYKGRSREMPKAQLRAMITSLLGVPATNILGEYGMSELSSQAYDGVAGQAPGPPGFVFPPWARARIISAETGGEVEKGKTGLLQVFDLANIWSVMAVQTEDLVVSSGKGFQILGRAEASPARGCSLMAAS